MSLFTKKPPFDVSSSILNQMLRYLSFKGIDTEAFLSSAGLDPQQIMKPDERIPIETYIFLEEEAAKLAEDIYFGLHMGQFVEPGSWSIIGYLMMNCVNLAQAFQKSGKYSRIIGNLIQGKGGLYKGKLKLTLFVPPDAPCMSRHCYETVLSGSVRMIHTLSGRDIYPVEVHLNYPPPGPVQEYERLFKCPIFFNRKDISMIMEPSILTIPVLHPDPTMLAHFEDYAKKFMEELDDTNPIVRRVTKILLSQIDNSGLSIWTIAKTLNMSVRTLQNHLTEEGTSFSLLLRETREKLAKKYLRENYSVEDITYLLGFSDPSVFRKAFKKWSGQTPKEYRRGVS